MSTSYSEHSNQGDSEAENRPTDGPKPWAALAVEADPANAPDLEFDDVPAHDRDGLSRVCPQCSCRAEYPDCVECGYDFEAGPNQGADDPHGRTADRLALSVPDDLRRLPNWLLWKRVPQPGKKDRKVPTYVSGIARHGEQGSPDDRASLVTFDQAMAAFRGRSEYAGVGFAMLGDDITALDFDGCIDEAGVSDPEVLALVAGTYAEKSPSGRGVRAFLRGTMSNKKHDAGQPTGIEVFCDKGFVTITGDVLPGCPDIATLTEDRRAAINARLGRMEVPPALANQYLGPVVVDDRVLVDLRSALNAIAADNRDDWVYIGQCLRPLGNVGEELWLTWSQKSEKYDPADAARVWKSLDTQAEHGYVGVFAKAKTLGWVNTAGHVPQFGAPTKPKFGFVLARNLLVQTKVQWLIKHYVEANTSSLLFGPSTAGKSFLAIDWACCLATGTAWNDNAVEQGSVFIIAGEGHAGIKRRLMAWHLHNGVELASAPLFVSAAPAALAGEQSAKLVLAAVRELSASHGKPALIVVDTLARNLGPGDESSAEDIGSYVANLDLLRNELGCALLTVHHSGHQAQDRARGSSALKAAVDHEFCLGINGEQRILKCTKAKDSEPPDPMAFALKMITLDCWAADGEETPTSCVLVPATGTVASKRSVLKGSNRIAMDELWTAIADHGVPPTDSIVAETGELCAPTKVVHEEFWRERCYKAGISDREQAAKQKAFARAKTQLRDREYVRTWEDFYWPLRSA